MEAAGIIKSGSLLSTVLGGLYVSCFHLMDHLGSSKLLDTDID